MQGPAKAETRIQVQVAAMQQEAPWMIPGYTYSEDSDAEDNGQDRVQPGIEAILANTQPRCARYFRSGTCTDYLIAACPGFRLRYLFATWADLAQDAASYRLYNRSEERSALRAVREAAARDELAATRAFHSQASTLAAT